MNIVRRVACQFALIVSIVSPFALVGCGGGGGGGDNSVIPTQVRWQNTYSKVVVVKCTDCSTNTSIDPGGTSSWYDVGPGDHAYSVAGPATANNVFTIRLGDHLTIVLKPTS